MKYYKDSDNQTYIYKDDGSEDHLISSDQIQITEAEANTLADQEFAARPYSDRRRTAYKPLAEQLDMQYWDKVNGTTTWQDHINEVKAKYPKGSE